MIRRLWRDLGRQPRWYPRLMLVSAAFTVAGLLMSGPNRGFGGPAVYYTVLSFSGVLLVLSAALILSRRGTDDR